MTTNHITKDDQSANFSLNSEHLTHPKYRADIDGLRAIAIFCVVGFHAFPNLVKGGFIGVDVFFVISGYLISTILIGNLERNSFSFVEFYIRRINRIFPALLLVLIASFIFGWFALLADEYKQLGKHIAGGAGFIQNFLLWNESGYFDNAAETKPLLHLWSLGIEEQFYIIWPLLLWFAWRYRLNFLAIVIAVGALSFTLNVVKVQSDEVAVFYSPQTRFWELMVGSVLAYMTLHRREKFPKLRLWLDKWSAKIVCVQAREETGNAMSDVQSMLGAALIAIGVLVITKERLFPGWWAVLPTVGTVLIIAAGAKAWLNRVVLSNRVLVWFGLISFPLYLWHWPLLSFARIMEMETPAWEIRFAAVIISIVLAWMTYRLIEKPIRFSKHGKLKPIMLIVFMAGIGYAGFNCFERDGFAFRDKSVIADYDWGKAVSYCRQSHPDLTIDYCLQSKPGTPSILLLGDSHSYRLFPGLAEDLAGTTDNVLQLGGGGCLPFFDVSSFFRSNRDVCAAQMNLALRFAEEQASVRTVVMSSRSLSWLSGKSEQTISLTNMPEISDFRMVFKIAMKKTIGSLLEKNKKIVFVLDVPNLEFDPKLCVASGVTSVAV
jgi:peptidoglycan/LPS O-acetylase OafA/YrhL